jgi:hypothetical protein
LSAIFNVVIAAFEIIGFVAELLVPAKSPPNWIFPLVLVDASVIVTVEICVSTYVFTAF